MREQWQRTYGLEGLAGADFDRHLDAVLQRLSVTDRCSQLNGPHQRMKAGADKLGWSFKTVPSNIDERRYCFETAGYTGFGDQTGAKQSAVKTYLQDAHDRGAALVTRCWAQRIVVQRHRAKGVEETWSDPGAGLSARITVEAPQVVVACGALESAALLLRSGIGGPAVGDYLRLHPCTATVGFYSDDLEGWKGAPQAGIVDEFENTEQGHGFLIESPHYTTAFPAAALPHADGASHKRLMSNFRRGAALIALLRAMALNTVPHGAAQAARRATDRRKALFTTGAATRGSSCDPAGARYQQARRALATTSISKAAPSDSRDRGRLSLPPRCERRPGRA